MIFITIILGKIIIFISKLLNLGSGGTWPGEIALILDKNILAKLTRNIHDKIILVAGTNGKSTTAKMIKNIFEEENLITIHNTGGGNVLNGIISTIIANIKLNCRIDANWLVFEVDEATLSNILKVVEPKAIVLTNLFRDQLDRYGEVDLLAEKWLFSLKKLPKSTILILNADDPKIAYLGHQLLTKNYYFGLNDQKLSLNKTPYALDSAFCPICQTRLDYKSIYLSHLGDWKCPKCKFSRPNLDLNQVSNPLEGVYNSYNALAAFLATKILGVKEETIKTALKKFTPAFGRQEEIKIDGKIIKLYLSKNPTGMNETIRTVINNSQHLTFNNKTILLVLNDRIPDGRDVSWIWDVDMEELQSSFNNIIVSGDRALDMGLRMKYSSKIKNQSFGYAQDKKSKIKNANQNLKVNENIIIEEDLRKAIQTGLAKTETGEIFYILPTYSAMLEIRKILTGKKIL